MRMEQLQYLVGIQETGSIVKTAKQYFISPQAVSKAVKALEREWGLVLLERSPKSVAFTDAGLLACQFARNVLKEYGVFNQAVAEYKIAENMGEAQLLTIDTIPRFVTPTLFSIIKKLKKQNPGLEVAIRNLTVRQILNKEKFLPDEVNILAFYWIFPQDVVELLEKQGLKYRILKKIKFHVCVHNSMPLAKKDTVSQKELNQYAYAAFRNDYYEEDIVTAKYKIDSFEQQRILLKQGDCYCRCTESEFELFFKKGFKLLPVDDEVYTFFVAIYHPDYADYLEQFLDAMEKYL